MGNKQKPKRIFQEGKTYYCAVMRRDETDADRKTVFSIYDREYSSPLRETIEEAKADLENFKAEKFIESGIFDNQADTAREYKQSMIKYLIEDIKNHFKWKGHIEKCHVEFHPEIKTDGPTSNNECVFYL